MAQKSNHCTYLSPPLLLSTTYKMFSKLLIVMTAALAAVNAQSSASAPATTSVPNIDACILACIQPAAAQNGCA